MWVILFLGFVSAKVPTKLITKSNEIVTSRDYKLFVDKMVVRNKKETNFCKKHAKPHHGKMVVAWEVDDQGHPNKFTRGSDTVQNDKVYHCLIHKIENWKFPKPPRDRALDVEYEFEF